MGSGYSVVDEIRMLMHTAREGSLSRTQFENRRASLLMAAEAELIQQKEFLREGVENGTLDGQRAAVLRKQLDQAERALVEAANLIGLSVVRRSADEDHTHDAAPAVSKPNRTHKFFESPELESDIEIFALPSAPSTPSLSLPKSKSVGRFMRRVGTVLPTLAGALVFAPVGVMVLMGKIDGWLPIWGLVMVLMAVACVVTARERWEHPGST